MATRRVSRLPYDPVVPSQPVVVQCRIGPGTFFKTPQKSDFIAPPNMLVFCKVTESLARTGIQKGRPVNVKRKREGEVHDVICNMQDIGSRDLQCELRALGVTWDGVFDATGAQRYPDQIGRLSVIVGGAVTIHINRKELDLLGVGDMLAWELEDNGLVVEGLPRTFSSVKIVKAAQRTSSGNVEAPEMSLRNWFSTRLEMNATNADEIQKRLFALASFTEGSYGDVYFGGVSPYAVARAAGMVQLTTMTDVTDWEDALYNPASSYYIMRTKPTSHASPEWLEHAFGWRYSSTHETKTGVNNAFDTFPGRDGWFGNNTKDWTEATGKTLLQTVATMTTPPEDKTSDAYWVYKAVHNLPFTYDEVAQLTLTPGANRDDLDEIAKFVKPLLDAGLAHLRLNWIVFLKKGVAKKISASKTSGTSATFPPAGAAEDYDVEVKANGADSELTFANVYSMFRLLVAANVEIEGYEDTVLTPILDAAAATPTALSINTEELYTYIRELFQKRLRLGTNRGDTSRVFGMLLEKSTGSDEARVLLCPGAAAV